MSSSFAAFWLDARLRLATPTISTLFCMRRPGMCLDRVLAPAPMIPMRSVSVAMGGSSWFVQGGVHSALKKPPRGLEGEYTRNLTTRRPGDWSCRPALLESYGVL